MAPMFFIGAPGNHFGADGETRTRTSEETAPSRQRVYQFHHIGYFNKLRRCP